MDDYEQKVRERAHRLWQQEGCPEGRAHVHWEKARELVAIEENQKRTLKPVSAEATGQHGEPVEPIEAAENAGEFPTLTDQGEEQTLPKRSSPKRSSKPKRTSTRKR